MGVHMCACVERTNSHVRVDTCEVATDIGWSHTWGETRVDVSVGAVALHVEGVDDARWHGVTNNKVNCFRDHNSVTYVAIGRAGPDTNKPVRQHGLGLWHDPGRRCFSIFPIFSIFYIFPIFSNDSSLSKHLRGKPFSSILASQGLQLPLCGSLKKKP